MSPRNTLSDYGGHFGGLAFMVVVFLLAMWINSRLNGDGFFSIFHDLLGSIVTLIQFASAIIGIIIIGVAIHHHIQDGGRFDREPQNKTNRLKSEHIEKEGLTNILAVVKSRG